MQHLLHRNGATSFLSITSVSASVSMGQHICTMHTVLTAKIVAPLNMLCGVFHYYVKIIFPTQLLQLSLVIPSSILMSSGVFSKRSNQHALVLTRKRLRDAMSVLLCIQPLV